MTNENNSSNPKYFYCYLDNERILNRLSDEQAGKLWKMLFAYANGDKNLNLDDTAVMVLFDMMSYQIERDFEKYRDKCEKNKANANARKRSKAVANDGSQEKDKDKDKEKDKDKNKDKYKEKDKNKDEEKDNAPASQSSTETAGGLGDLYLSTDVDARSSIDNEYVINKFNLICKSLPRVQKITDTRKKKIQALRKHLGDYTLEDYFIAIEQSDFLSGRSGKWTGCNFDWALNPENIAKVIEGNYINKPKKGKIEFLGCEERSYDLEELENRSEFN